MMLTDDELTSLITSRYEGAALRVPVEAVEARGTRRRRNVRVATGAALAVVLAATVGGTAFGLDRYRVAQRAAAFQRECQAAYTAEAAKTHHGDQMPATLGRPVVEMHRGQAVFRVYRSAGAPLRPTTFDCLRTAAGDVSGRVSYGPKAPAADDPADLPYLDYLPDGSAAMVNPETTTRVRLVPSSADDDVAIRVAGGVQVAWGSRAAVDRLQASGQLYGGGVHAGPWPFALTATYQDEVFEQKCLDLIAEHTSSTATLLITARHGTDRVAKVYRYGETLAICAWGEMADDPANGLSYNGPAAGLASGTNSDGSAPSFGSTLMSVEIDYSSSWVTGAAPAGTESVRIVTADGTSVDAQVADDTYLAWIPGAGAGLKIIATTATQVWTAVGSKVSHTPR